MLIFELLDHVCVCVWESTITRGFIYCPLIQRQVSWRGSSLRLLSWHSDWLLSVAVSLSVRAQRKKLILPKEKKKAMCTLLLLTDLSHLYIYTHLLVESVVASYEHGGGLLQWSSTLVLWITCPACSSCFPTPLIQTNGFQSLTRIHQFEPGVSEKWNIENMQGIGWKTTGPLLLCSPDCWGWSSWFPPSSQQLSWSQTAGPLSAYRGGERERKLPQPSSHLLRWRSHTGGRERASRWPWLHLRQDLCLLRWTSGPPVW